MSGDATKLYEYWGKDVSVPAMGSSPFLAARPFTVKADLELDKPASSGAVLAWGSRFGGWSLYLDEGRPSFAWAQSTDPKEMAQVTAEKTLQQGKATLTMRFETERPGGPAEVVLSSAGSELARVKVQMNVLMPAGGGETLDIGRDLGVPVTEYKTPHGQIEGDVPHVTIEFD